MSIAGIAAALGLVGRKKEGKKAKKPGKSPKKAPYAPKC